MISDTERNTRKTGNCRESRRSSPGNMSGFSVVELMVASTISLVLLAGIVQIFVNNKQAYRVNEVNSRLQESGRSAMTILQRDIRPAGYQGCRSMDAITPTVIANAPVPTIDASTIISGYEYTGASWTPSLPAALGTVTAGTDVITVQRASDCGANLTGNMGTVNANIQINFPNACNFSANETLLISDCTSADIFRASNVSNGTSIQTVAHANNVNTSNNLSKTYNDDADLLKFSSFTYYIATGANGQPSLWRYDNTSGTVAGVNPVELVNDVADMQIEYGQDTSGDEVANFYETADNITDWSQVTNIRISLLVRSDTDNIASNNQTYTFDRASVTAADRRLHRVFTTTIVLRNKVS